MVEHRPSNHAGDALAGGRCHFVATATRRQDFLDMYARVRYGVLHFEQKCLRAYMEFVQ
jgi:hypothetical protein